MKITKLSNSSYLIQTTSQTIPNSQQTNQQANNYGNKKHKITQKTTKEKDKITN